MKLCKWRQTSNGRADQGRDALEQQQHPECVGKPVEAEEINENDGSKSHVRADQETKKGAINREWEETVAKGTQSRSWKVDKLFFFFFLKGLLTNATQREAAIINP